MASKKSGIDKTTFIDLIAHRTVRPNDDAELQLHLTVFYDQESSWMEVPLSLIHMLGFKPQDFSRFSYVDNENNLIYLDETIDARAFMRRLHQWPSDHHLDNMSQDDPSAQIKLDGETLLAALHLHTVPDGEVSNIRDLKRNAEDQPLH
jgi:hypothetical protein